MEFEGDRPVVYVAPGSHASYHTSEEHFPDKVFVPGDVVVGGASGRTWAQPEPLDKPWFTDFKGRWGAVQWEGLGDIVINELGGPPTGPKFDRQGHVRSKWGKPTGYADLA
jgi:hypothetical protein